MSTPNPDIETQLTEALAIQRLLVGNDLLGVRSKLDLGEEPTPHDAASVNVRAGRIQALLFALRLLWGDEKFARFCDTVGIAEDELSDVLTRENETYAAFAGEIWAFSAKIQP